MATTKPRLTVTLEDTWTEELDEVKRTLFLNGSRADVIRYLIGLGLQAWRATKNSPVVGATGERH